jgi:peptidoglycan-associated lipoprotein
MKNFTLKNCFVAVIATMLALSLSACGQKSVQPAPPEAVDSAKVEAVSDAQSVAKPTEAMGTEEPLESEPVEDSVASLEGRTSNGLFPVYFDFDKSSIRADQVERMEKNAAFMKENSGVRVQIEGNCDERGTNEYNMALGERRAMSAKKYMVNLGVTEGRLNTISYGEERPINFGHDELSWSQNRRNDFVIGK